MKLSYENMGHLLLLGEEKNVELVIENKKMFLEVVESLTEQIEGGVGKAVLSIDDRPVELSRYADITVSFAPFHMNRKPLLTKLCNALEEKALAPEHYIKAGELLRALELFVDALSEDFPFDVECQKAAVGPLLRAIAPEVADNEKSTVERILNYMEIVRELDRERLFVFVNMRTYFADEEMNAFLKTTYRRDHRVLLVESADFPRLENCKRYTVDADLCEF